ncbi:hypothetical protein O0I10_010334 [Lichtheimia ornata]|uniref:chitinase n=1 Tax=Lichtheimia ornata TaxID=688661 RepID=A0AAD7UVN3_9FUNG|nr:uncharacterized protein O0I10_010334 [Lichtheimia ornata]KAJ8653998.1 hypothetical protein O0I10_010334 [Lichtheimia ornata]
MIFGKSSTIVAGSILFGFVHQAVAASFPSGVVTYWGQNSANSESAQKGLAEYCDDSSDVLIAGFITNYNVGDLPTLNLANACTGTFFDGTNLLKCDQVGKDIQTCQKKGKKVLLSLGGASGAYGFKSDDEGKTFAKTLWDLFGGGDSKTRPFGDSIIDGFDLDIEGGGSTGYVAMINELRTLFKKDSSKDYFITAAPQCPFPDAMLGDVISEAGVDAVNVQFYNNYCSTTGSSFNFDQWDDWAKNKSPNKDVKVFLGIPGSSTAAGSGYAKIEDLKPIIKDLSKYSSYGGVTVWDASQSYNNKDASPNFAVALADIVHDGSSSSGGDDKGNDDDSTSDAGNDKTVEQPSTTGTTPDPTSSSSTSDGGAESSTTTTSTTSAPSPSNTDNNDDNEDSGQENGTCIQDGDECSTDGQYKCVGSGFAVCNHGKWVVQQCAAGLSCMSTTDGSSIYCTQTSGSVNKDTCSNKQSLTSIADVSGPAPKAYNAARVTSQLSVKESDEDSFKAVVNARRKDSKPFGSTVVVQMTMPPNIKVTSVDNGKVQQKGRNVKIQLKNTKKKSMSLVFTIAGSVDQGSVFSAPSANSIKFMT